MLLTPLLLAAILAQFHPCTVQACCYPDTYHALTYMDLETEMASTLVDFTQNKEIYRPEDGTFEYILHDRNINMTYTRYKNGTCIQCTLTAPLRQCPLQGVNLIEEYNYVLGGKLVDAYFTQLPSMAFSDGILLAMTRDGCLPVYSIYVALYDNFLRFYANVTSPVHDVSDLDQDVSDCQYAL